MVHPDDLNQNDFIKLARTKFVKQKGRRVYAGILFNGAIYPLPIGSQKNGKLIRKVEEILVDVHKSIIESRVKTFISGQLPNGTPYEKSVLPVPDNIVSAYPELMELQNKFLVKASFDQNI